MSVYVYLCVRIHPVPQLHVGCDTRLNLREV